MTEKMHIFQIISRSLKNMEWNLKRLCLIYTIFLGNFCPEKENKNTTLYDLTDARYSIRVFPSVGLGTGVTLPVFVAVTTVTITPWNKMILKTSVMSLQMLAVGAWEFTYNPRCWLTVGIERVGFSVELWIRQQS